MREWSRDIKERMFPLFVAVLLALVCTLPFVSREARADDPSSLVAQVYMVQIYDVPVSGLTRTFEYLIVPAEEDAPLPLDDSGEPISSFTLTSDESRWMEFPVVADGETVTEPRVYHYVLKPKTSDLESGLYYVDAQSENLNPGVNVYVLEINVLPGEGEGAEPIVIPLVHCEEWDGPKVSDPRWRIGYEKQEVTPQPSDNTDRQWQPWSNPLYTLGSFIGGIFPGSAIGNRYNNESTRQNESDGGKDTSSRTTTSTSGSNQSGSGTAGSGAVGSGSQTRSTGATTPGTQSSNATTNGGAGTPATGTGGQVGSSSNVPSATTVDGTVSSGTPATQVSGSIQPLGATADGNTSIQVLVALVCVGVLLLGIALRVRRVGGSDA